MGYIQGEGWTQGILFPVVLDELVPADHVRRVIDAFVTKLAMTDLDFTRADEAYERAVLLGPGNAEVLAESGRLFGSRFPGRVETAGIGPARVIRPLAKRRGSCRSRPTSYREATARP